MVQVIQTAFEKVCFRLDRKDGKDGRMTEAPTMRIVVILFAGRVGFAMMIIITSMTHRANHRRNGEQHTKQDCCDNVKKFHDLAMATLPVNPHQYII
jgi:hypothetical protein